MSFVKSVLVTGADGFIGSHLVEALVQRGFKVRALCQYNSFGHRGWLEDSPLASDIEFVLGDIRDLAQCQQITRGIETVFHLAALIAIPYSYAAPASYVQTNVIGTLNMCQAARDQKVGHFIQTSTSEVYGTARYTPIDEQHPLQPQSPYSASKIAADAMTMSFFHAYGLPVTIARPFNTYGPRQSARAVIPTVITQIARGAKQIKLGETRPTRDFNYVTDTCEGFIAISQGRDMAGKTVNLATNREVSIGATVALIQTLMGSSIEVISDEQRLRPASSEVFRLRGDNQLMCQLTGFQPKTSLEQGLRQTIDWFTQSDNLSRYQNERYAV